VNSLSMSGLILAGGQGLRMGGVDKGLQLFKGKPLVQHAIERLQMQEGAPLSSLMIAANRNLSSYEAFGLPVWTDADAAFKHTQQEPVASQFAGPLAGMLSGLKHCTTDLMLTVPCDSPFFPLQLAQQLRAALLNQNVNMAVATTLEEDGVTQMQAVFCLMRASLRDSLLQFMNQGGRKLSAWAASQGAVEVPFEMAPSKVTEGRNNCSNLAFSNANSLEELRKLERAELTQSPHLSSTLN